MNRDQETTGYTARVEMGLQDFAFEAVTLRHTESFTAEAPASPVQVPGERVRPELIGANDTTTEAADVHGAKFKGLAARCQLRMPNYGRPRVLEPMKRF